MVILKFKSVIHNFLIAVPFADFVIFEANELPDLLIIGIMFKLPDILNERGTMNRVIVGDYGNVAQHLHLAMAI